MDGLSEGCWILPYGISWPAVSPSRFVCAAHASASGLPISPLQLSAPLDLGQTAIQNLCLGKKARATGFAMQIHTYPAANLGTRLA